MLDTRLPAIMKRFSAEHNEATATQFSLMFLSMLARTGLQSSDHRDVNGVEFVSDIRRFDKII